MQISVGYDGITGGTLTNLNISIDEINLVQEYFTLEINKDFENNTWGTSIPVNGYQSIAQTKAAQLIFSNKPFADNRAFHGGRDIFIVSTSFWKTYLSEDVSFKSYVFFAVAWAMETISDDALSKRALHKGSAGCLFDPQTRAKGSWLWKMKVGQICPDCVKHMKARAVEQDAINAINCVLEPARADTLCIPLPEKELRLRNKEREVLNNLKRFIDDNPPIEFVKKFGVANSIPEGNEISEKSQRKKRISECDTVIITANKIEGIRVTELLQKETDSEELDYFSQNGQVYQFAQISGRKIVHVWPRDMASFTSYGSFHALASLLEEKNIKRVISLGVAFGIDPKLGKQSLGDVLVSKSIIPYDAFNKETDGVISIRTEDCYTTSDRLLNYWQRLIDVKGHIEEEAKRQGVRAFKWHAGALLSGGTVLSDIAERERLLDAASAHKDIVGGEMEGHGVYFACKEKDIPCITIKGICDWGALKNGWKKAGVEELNDVLKDSIQVMAVENAFFAVKYLLTKLPLGQIDQPAQTSTKEIEKEPALSKSTNNLLSKQACVIKVFAPSCNDSIEGILTVWEGMSNYACRPDEVQILLSGSPNQERNADINSINRLYEKLGQGVEHGFIIKRCDADYKDPYFILLGNKVLAKMNTSFSSIVTIQNDSVNGMKKIEEHIRLFDKRFNEAKPYYSSQIS